MISSELLEGDEIHRCQELVRLLPHLAMITRCDIAYSVNRLSQARSKPSKPDLAPAYKVPHIGGYSNAPFAANLDRRQSTMDYLFSMEGIQISMPHFTVEA